MGMGLESRCPMLRRLLILLALFALPLLHAAPVFETLADFERVGTVPTGRLLAHSDGNYYGTTIVGGVSDLGTVFRMTPAGALTTIVSFTGGTGPAIGAYPSGGLVLGPDGLLYGTTVNGGAGDFGTIFKVSTAGVFTNIVDFTGAAGLRPGAIPNPLIFHVDGFFYGSTQGGGTSEMGTIFKLSTTGVLTTLVHLTGTTGTSKGMAPTGRLFADGPVLYGTTQSGGASDLGTVFKVATNGTSWVPLVEFTGTTGGRLGSGPLGGVALFGGMLFGTTETGGTEDAGTIFRVDPAGGNFTVMRHFAGPDGSYPAAPLLSPGDGFLYGCTAGGGNNDVGVAFRIGATSGAFTALASFTGDNGSAPGAGPRAGLIVGLNGELFGTTEAGGQAGNGTAFQITTSGVVTSLAAFTNATGWSPAGAPLATTTGVVIPLNYGGAKGCGTSMRIPPSGPAVLEHTFQDSIGAPAGSFIEVSGNRFGLSQERVLFRLIDSMSPAKVATISASIAERAEELIDGGDGYLYGTSEDGGTSGKGSFFRVTTSGWPALLVSFTGPNGENPGSTLAMGADGNFYGTTKDGGTTGNGTIFKVTPAGALTSLVSFTGSGPRKPKGGLVAGVDGNFYGTTSDGGSAGQGTVFRVTPAGVFTVLYEFTGGSGTKPGRLLAALDGTLYGCTENGGASGNGTVFRISPGGAFTSLFSFTGTTGNARGKTPKGHLAFGPGGVLYGVAPEGGTGGGGTVFRIPWTGPHVATRPAQKIDNSTCLLNAILQAGGESTSVVFDYGTTSALGQTTGPAVSALTVNSADTFSIAIPPPPAGQTVFFRARATNISGTSQGPILSYTSPTASAQWKLDNLGDAAAPDLGDPDGDGIATIIEYALVQNPASANTLPAATRANLPEGPRLTIAINRDPQRNDITIEVLSGSGVNGPWTTVASSTNGAPFTGLGYVSGEISGTGVRTVLIKDSAAPAASPSRFMRIRVVH